MCGLPASRNGAACCGRPPRVLSWPASSIAKHPVHRPDGRSGVVKPGYHVLTPAQPPQKVVSTRVATAYCEKGWQEFDCNTYSRFDLALPRSHGAASLAQDRGAYDLVGKLYLGGDRFLQSWAGLNIATKTREQEHNRLQA